MKSRHYGIVKEHEGRLLWLEDAVDLDSAKSRIQELTSFWPGEFQVMDQQNHQTVAKITKLPDAKERDVKRDFARH